MLPETSSAAEPFRAFRAVPLPPGEAPFFIFGAPRSGTSLLSRMLNQHSRLAVPFESQLFRYWTPLLPLYGDLREPGRCEALVDDILACPVIRKFSPVPQRRAVLATLPSRDFGGVVAGVLGAFAKSQGKTRWGEKSPYHAYHWNEIRSCFPRARVLHIVRDGRDTALSFLRARQGPKTIFAAAQIWRRYLEQMQQIREHSEPAGFLELHYCELLDRPEKVLGEVFRFLGESYESDALEFHLDATPYETDAINAENLHRPLMSQNQQKWRREMSPRALEIFEAVAGETLQRHGYELSCPQRSLGRAERLWHSLAQHPPRLVGRLRDHQGQREALYRLRVSARLVFERRFSRSSARAGA